MKMKMIIILAVSVLMSGCVYQDANNTDLRKAVAFCKGVSNIATLAINMVGDEIVTCVDSSSKVLDGYKLETK